ncbi:MAG TPA: dihydroneopterin aldolase [Acidobacteriota bacterium]|nr:dihydroneopterin aldolase [bacterium]HNX19392.1 dihydroneopterin aldolase [Acidobacteriota bacterium]
MRGRVLLSGIRFHAFHGLTKLERQIGVRYRVDIAMTTEIGRAGRSDDIEDAIDYRVVHEMVVEIGRNNSFRLIETLAVRVAESLLRRFPTAEKVEIRVCKETPVLDGMVDSVGVEAQLTREELPE